MGAPIFISKDEPVVVNNDEEDIDRKEKTIINLVDNAVQYFIKNKDIDFVCSNFTHDPLWRKGEIFIFVLDSEGYILTHGNDKDIIWQNINFLVKNTSDKSILESIKSLPPDGAWIDFQWNRGSKLSYIKRVTKDGEVYFIGAGFFPESKEYFVKQLVRKAAHFLGTNGIHAIKSIVQNPFGEFVKGNLSVFISDFNGIVIADPIYVGSVGQNMSKLVDQNGKPIGKLSLEIAKSLDGEGWISAKWKNTQANNFIAKTIDTTGKKPYYISSTLYPDITLENVVALIRKSISHIKAAGANKAFSDFNNPEGHYVYGPLSMFVYDLEGNNLANGEYSYLIGQNLIDRIDEYGKPYVKEMIEEAKKNGKGIINIFEKNDYKTIYFELINVPDGRFVIGSGFFPTSKSQSVENIVNKGIALLQNTHSYSAMKFFKDKNGEYYKGDVSLKIYQDDGTLLIDGFKTNKIWQNFFEDIDDKGIKITQEIIALAKSGGGWITYKIKDSFIKTYVKSVSKVDNKSKILSNYIVTSSYYL